MTDDELAALKRAQAAQKIWEIAQESMRATIEAVAAADPARRPRLMAAYDRVLRLWGGPEDAEERAAVWADLYHALGATQAEIDTLEASLRHPPN